VYTQPESSSTLQTKTAEKAQSTTHNTDRSQTAQKLGLGATMSGSSQLDAGAGAAAAAGSAHVPKLPTWQRTQSAQSAQCLLTGLQRLRTRQQRMLRDILHSHSGPLCCLVDPGLARMLTMVSENSQIFRDNNVKLFAELTPRLDLKTQIDDKRRKQINIQTIVCILQPTVSLGAQFNDALQQILLLPALMLPTQLTYVHGNCLQVDNAVLLAKQVNQNSAESWDFAAYFVPYTTVMCRQQLQVCSGVFRCVCLLLDSLSWC
jgi:hypothetical protein